jgi:hypothetical protein
MNGWHRYIKERAQWVREDIAAKRYEMAVDGVDMLEGGALAIADDWERLWGDLREARAEIATLRAEVKVRDLGHRKGGKDR